jgi:hypothetical protein
MVTGQIPWIGFVIFSCPGFFDKKAAKEIAVSGIRRIARIF